MRRAPIVIAATVLGTAGVLLFKPIPASSALTASGDPAAGSGGAAGAEAQAGASGAASASAKSSGSASRPAASASASPSPSATKAGANGTWTGAAVTTRYGTTQVRATVEGGRITAVDVLQYNDRDPRSAQISEYAIPSLRDEVLSKQTAAVDTVSGATYTSLAYEASLQAALDEAGYKAPDGSTASTSVGLG